jgi:hypothetical protein
LPDGFIPAHGGYRKLFSHPRAEAVRRIAGTPDATCEFYATNVEQGGAEVAANTVICLIHQANYLLDQQIRRLERPLLRRVVCASG